MEWMMILAYLNILWLAFTILGLGILGIFPSTIAMFTVTRKWMQGGQDLPIFKLFWKTYRSEFIHGQGIGYFLALLGGWLILDIKFFLHHQGPLFSILLIITITLLIFFFITLLYIFPMYVHFKMKFFQYIKYAFSIGLAHPMHTLMIATGTFGLAYVSFKFSGLIVVWSGSFFALWISFGTHQVFKKMPRELM
jgi:uncharacterized membrane protein YesL